MAVKIQSTEIQNLQQMEVVVAGPEDANQLVIIDGQIDHQLVTHGAANAWAIVKETFSVLVGPTFTRKQFVRANATASLRRTQVVSVNAADQAPPGASWSINAVDADWDDESGQVELRIEAQVTSKGAGQEVAISGIGFHVTILAAIATPSPAFTVPRFV